MEKARMQEIVDLILSEESHADVIDLLSRLKIPMDDFHDYTFKIQPGAQAHFEVDVLSSIQPHVHRFYEVIFVVQGNSINYIIDTQRYQLKKGDMFFIPPGHIHHPLLGAENSQPYKRYVLWLEADFFHRVCSIFPSIGYLFSKCEQKKDYLLRSNDSEYLNLLESFKSLCEEATRQRYGWKAQTALNAFALMNQLSRAYNDHCLTTIHPMPQTKFDAAIKYINQNLDQQLTLEDVAQQIYVSKSTLSHLFRENLGISVYQYIQKKRLLKAKLLILEGENMSSICGKCGFADYPTFYRAFKKCTMCLRTNIVRTTRIYEESEPDIPVRFFMDLVILQTKAKVIMITAKIPVRFDIIEYIFLMVLYSFHIGRKNDWQPSGRRFFTC